MTGVDAVKFVKRFDNNTIDTNSGQQYFVVYRQINRLSMILDDRCTNEINSLYQKYAIRNKRTFIKDCIQNSVDINEMIHCITQIEQRFGLKMQPIDCKKYSKSLDTINLIDNNNLDAYIQSEMLCLWNQIKDCTCLNLQRHELFDWIWYKSPIKEKANINRLKDKEVFKFWFFSTIYHLIYGQFE